MSAQNFSKLLTECIVIFFICSLPLLYPSKNISMFISIVIVSINIFCIRAGVKGSPAYVHLYRYPNFQDTTSALANKSFFKVIGSWVIIS